MIFCIHLGGDVHISWRGNVSQFISGQVVGMKLSSGYGLKSQLT